LQGTYGQQIFDGYGSAVSIFWVGNLVSGPHSIAIMAKATNACTFNSGFSSGFYVLEFRQG
jgi:hypothetical protein